MRADTIEKINKAKENFTTPEDRQVISEWEERLRKHGSWRQFQENEITKDVLLLMKKRIVQLRSMLSKSRDTEIMKNQQTWWKIIDELSYWYKAMSHDWESEEKSIEEEINKELVSI
jgi:molybdopterin converting factor small subunit